MADSDDYSLPLHIGGLFANMAASALGVLLPILFAYTTFNAKTTGRIHSVIQTARNFGSGVILATAFIHMLPSAFSDLSNESLPMLFQEDAGYGGWAGLIAMTSALLLHLLEFTATQRFFNRAKELKQQKENQARVHAMDRLQDAHGEKEKVRVTDTDSLEEGHASPAGLESVDPCVHVGHVHGGEILLVNRNNQSQQDQFVKSPDSSLLAEEALAHAQEEKRTRLIGTYILEFGIALHSVIIGVSLGTTNNAGFVSLLIALLFHQFFEGVALGGRIASLKFARSSMSPWLLSFWFAISTPLGIAIGIGIRSSYDGESVTALIVEGVFDACSAGILLYTALVQLMSTELNANKSFREESTQHQAVQFAALWLGAAAMAVIGKWA
ncbi:hypothetical protein BGZ75_000983 [Mortierella antarctica]|nr:hypothetical protein BGZ75_000983 [Mortierella antarctica]